MSVAAGTRIGRYDRPSVTGNIVALTEASATAAALMLLYRWRGFGALLVGVFSAAILREAAMAHSLGSADTVAHGNHFYILLAILFGAGAWSYSRRRLSGVLNRIGSTAN